MSTITENFGVADNATLSGSNTWVEQANSNWRTFSNAAWLNQGSTGYGYAYISSATLASGDQKATGTLAGFLGEASSTIAIGPLLRSPGTSTEAGYAMRAIWLGDGTKLWDIVKYTTGSASEVQLTSNAQDPAVNDTFEFTCTQNGANVDLVGKVNGSTILTVTDSSSPITAANHNVGMIGYCVVVSSVNNALDSLTYSDIVAASTQAPRTMQQMRLRRMA